MRDFGTTAVCCTPTYFYYMVEKAAAVGIDMHKMPIRAGIFGAEPWTEEMRKRIEHDAGIKAYDIYGLSEIIGPGVAIECCCQKGMHIFEDHFYPEIINPETGEVLPDGEFGELVLTTLSKYAMPMIRYRTRDLTRIVAEPCECGRTIRRIERISSRSDDMFIIRGVNVFPSQIESVLIGTEQIGANYQLVVRREGFADTLEVRVELVDASLLESYGEIERLQKKIMHNLQTTLGIQCKVSLLEPKTLERFVGKAHRVVDLRNEKK